MTAAATSAIAPSAAATPAAVRALVACRSLAGEAAQLACYRSATDQLVADTAEGRVVIVGAEQAEDVRRQTFGLRLPSLSLFDKAASGDDLQRLVGQVRSARQDPTGRWILRLDTDAVWTQVEADPLRVSPKPGMPVTISKAALGSYKMQIGRQEGVRVRRIE